MDPKKWAKIWQANKGKLGAIRKKEILELNTQVALVNLLPAFEYARLHAPIRETSGLVEMQRLFQKLSD